MFDDCSLDEKMLICALYKETINQMKSNTNTNIPYTIAAMFGKQPRHPQYVIYTLAYITGLNLGEDIIKNSQISRVVWDNMDYSKRKRFIDSLFEIKQLPEVKDNLSVHFGINCVLCDVLRTVEPETICNPMAGQFFLEKYGLKGEVTTTM